MADNFDTLSIQITASATNAIKAVNKLADALDRVNTALGGINTGGLENVSRATDNLSNSISKISTRKIKNVAEGIQQVATAGGSVAQTADAANNVAVALGNAGQAAQTASKNIGSSMQSGASGMRELSAASEQTNKALQKVAPSASKVSKNIGGLFGSSIKAALISKGIVKEITRIGKMLKLMITRMVLRKVIMGVVDGFKNLVQYSKTFDSSVSLLWNSFRQLGNSIAAAVSPLINAFAPAINYVIQLVIKAVNVINQLISALMGLGTWTKAKVLTDSYAESLKNATGAAKELKKTVLGFDEINQLQDNKDSGSSGTNPADMFEQAPIDPKIFDFLNKLKKLAAELGNSFKNLWDKFKKGFKEALGDDWKSKIASIIDGAIRACKVVQRIFDDPEVKRASQRFVDSVITTLGKIAGSSVRIGLNIGVNLAQGIAKALEDKEKEIRDFLVNMFDIGADTSDKIGEFAVAIGEISDVLAGDNAIAATSEAFSIMAEVIMLVTENTAKLTKSFVDLTANPVIENVNGISDALDNLFGNIAKFEDAIDTILQSIRKTFSSVWDESLSPMVDDISEALSDITASVLELWNQYVSPFVDDLASDVKALWQTDLGPLFDDLIHILGIVGESLVKLWKTVLVPLFSFLTQVFGPQIKAVLTILWNYTELTIKYISLTVGTLVSVLRALLTFIKTGFKEGWSTAWENLKKDFINIWETMKTKMASIINVMIESINALMGSITSLVDNVSTKINELFGTKIPSITGKIRLEGFRGFATGGFPEDGLFMANHGELVGKFSNGRTAVANNEQITEGIASAVYAAIVSANGAGGNARYINNTIQIDGRTIARAVTQGQSDLNRRYSPTTV